MPKRVIFIDTEDTFAINETGVLYVTDANGNETDLVSRKNMSEFIGWLHDEFSAWEQKHIAEQTDGQS